MDQYTITTMNTEGPSGPGHASKRKQIIDNIITMKNPDLFLVQEFRWTNVWPGDHLEPYAFFGHEEAKIFFNVNKFEATIVDVSRLRQILEDPSNTFPIDFTPLPRMCVCRVKPKGVPLVEFICVSWHGRYKTQARIEDFQRLLRFLKLLCMKEGLPLLLGGDFNLNINDIKQYIVPPFKVHDYDPSDRRIGNIIDFYITRELEIGQPYPVDITTIIPDAYNVLDHDPISCILTDVTSTTDNADSLNPSGPISDATSADTNVTMANSTDATTITSANDTNTTTITVSTNNTTGVTSTADNTNFHNPSGSISDATSAVTSITITNNTDATTTTSANDINTTTTTSVNDINTTTTTVSTNNTTGVTSTADNTNFLNPSGPISDATSAVTNVTITNDTDATTTSSANDTNITTTTFSTNNTTGVTSTADNTNFHNPSGSISDATSAVTSVTITNNTDATTTTSANDINTTTTTSVNDINTTTTTVSTNNTTGVTSTADNTNFLNPSGPISDATSAVTNVTITNSTDATTTTSANDTNTTTTTVSTNNTTGVTSITDKTSFLNH